jgi:DNA-binding CsgD family transcriptional regulator
MPISDDGAPESITPDRVNALVGSSEVPLAAVDLPSGRLLAVNPGLAGALGSTVGALTGSSSLDWLSPDDRQAARLGFQALADGDLTGYQAIRRFTNPMDPDQVFSVWVSAVEVEGVRIGLASVVPLAEYDNQFRALLPVSTVPEPGSVVLGTVDHSWRVDRISQDVTPLLGLTPEQCAGRPVLGAIHPRDLPAFFAAVEHARHGERAVRLVLRLTVRSHDRAAVTVILATLSPGDRPPLAFALLRDDTAGDDTARDDTARDDTAADPPGPGDSACEMPLEAHVLRIGDELHAAGLIRRLAQLPVLADQPQLGQLTSREWAVLTRLLDGQRVSAIAADLFARPGTVREHLSSIYAKLGVHSQVDLIRRVRRGEQRPAADR